MTSTSVFMGSFTPTYAAALLSSGRAASALSFQSIVLYVSQLLAWVASGIVVPLMTVSLALGVTGSVTPGLRVGGVGKLIAKTATWVLTMGMLLFSGLLSLQALTGKAADGLGARALRFSVSTFVPVVGGSLGESLSTIRGCLELLHSTIGGFGVAATALIILPPLCRCLWWSLLMSICRAAAELFELKPIADIAASVQSTLKCLIGILSASGSFLIVAITVVTTATGG
jgi:stage III sporulation protein AE